MEQLIKSIEEEIKLLEQDTYNVHNNVSVSALEYAIEKRRETLKEIKNKHLHNSYQI